MTLIPRPPAIFILRTKCGLGTLWKCGLLAFAFLLALVALAPSTLAHAPIFGPKTFTRVPGKPEVFQERFTLSSVAGTFTLIVQNGDANGMRRIMSGEISLNGFKILDNSDFNSKTGQIEKVINPSVLSTANVLTVRLKGGPDVGSIQPPFITVSIIRHIDETDGPVITINKPQAAESFANSPIEVSGTVTDISGVASLKVNGAETPVVNNAFTSQVTLNPGSNQITVMATDFEGNSSQKSVEAILATPRLLAVNPTSGQAGLSVQVEIKGEFTHFVQGTTQANFGAGIAVGGGSEGAFGPVTVTNATTATAQLTINNAATVGPRTISVQTGAEQVELANAFTVTAPQPPPPSIISVTPNTAQAGQSISVTVVAQNTHFSQGTTQASFGVGIGVGGAAEGAFGPVTVNSATSFTAQLTINAAATVGPRTVSVQTGAEQVELANAFTVTAAPPPQPSIISVTPNTAQAGQSVSVTVVGQNTHFSQGTTQASFGAGIAVGPVTVNSATSFTAQLTINAAAVAGPRTVTVQTGAEQVELANAFTVTAAPPPQPSIISVTPNTAQTGQSISVTVAAQNTHFSQGTTQASFGAGIAVGGGAEGAIGPVTVNSATSFTAQLTINAAATVGPRTVSVQTGSEEVSLANSFTVTGTGEAPTISITSPAAGAFVFVKRPTIEVSYNAAAGIDFASLTFTANDQPLTTECQLNNAGGRCTSTSDLPEGAVTLAATIKDLGGISGTGTVQFTVDSAPVQISITTPAAGLITKEESVTVTGTFGPGVSSIKVNDVVATLTNNTFSAAVPLNEGVNMLVAVGTTANGKTGTNSVTVTLDTAAPIVRIDSPRDGFTSLENAVAITGVINDIVSGGVDAQIKVNGISATVSNGAFMVMTLPLVRGPNTIEAVATDSVGNVGKHSITVNFEVAVGARLTVLSGDGQKAVVKQSLPQPLVAVVKDDLGNPVAGRVVRFEVTRNSGTLKVNSGDAPMRVVQVPTDGSGRAAVQFTLGDTTGEGNNRVTATALGVAGEVGFCATALPAPANKILANMGDNQRGVTGQPLANRLEALVVDLDGNPLQGVDVTFTVVKGNGRLDGQESLVKVTGNDGIARAVLTLGPDPGISNNVVNATFEGLTGLPATFTASGLAPGDPANTRFSGVVLDNGHTPIPGAIVTIDGTNLQATTDQNGQFLLTNVPVGHIHLHIDPTKSPRPETFPELAFVTVTVAGQNNILGQPILIPALDMENSKIVGGNQDVTLTMRGVPGLAMTIFANSVRCPGGATTCRVTISQVHLDKVPMAPPNGTLFMPPAWTIQPHGVHFTIPARMTIPNNGLAPGRIIDMFQFDHDLNMFVNIGKGTVSQDGLTITTDPGFGITAAGWGGGGPPPPPTTCASKCAACETCQNGACVKDTSLDQACCQRAKDYEDYRKDRFLLNPRKVFSVALDCVASDICKSAGPMGRDIDDPNWLLCINRELYNRWKAHDSVCWITAELACNASIALFPTNIPAQQAACFGAMAACHDGLDMLDSLKACGCGTAKDWDKVGDIVGDCSFKLFDKAVEQLSRIRGISGCQP